MSGLIKKLGAVSLVAVGMGLSVPAIAHETDGSRDWQIDWLASMAESGHSKSCYYSHLVSDQYAASVKEGIEEQISGYIFSHVKTERDSILCLTKDPINDYSFTDIYNRMGDLIK